MFAGAGGLLHNSAGVVVVVGNILDAEFVSVAAFGLGASKFIGAGVSIIVGKRLSSR